MPEATPARAGLYGTWMLTRREMARYWNVWGQTIIPPVVTAALFLFVFGHALGNRIGTFDGVPYLAFLAPGLVVQGAITNAYNNTSSSLFDARRAKYIEDVLTSPLKNWQVVLAYAFSGASRGAIIGVLTLAIAWPITDGWALQPLLFLAILVSSCIAFALLGLIAGLYASRWDHIFVPLTFILTPLTFLGGVFYPVSELPPDLAFASRLNPILYIVDALRGATLGVHDLPIGPTLGWFVLFDIWLFAVVLRLFTRSSRLRG